MRYQKNKSKALNWKKWLSLHRDNLINDCGIPLVVLEKQDNWYYFLDHCYFSSSPGYIDIDVDKLDRYKALKLCLFLENDQSDSGYECDALNRLQYILNRGKHHT